MINTFFPLLNKQIFCGLNLLKKLAILQETTLMGPLQSNMKVVFHTITLKRTIEGP